MVPYIRVMCGVSSPVNWHFLVLRAMDVMPMVDEGALSITSPASAVEGSLVHYSMV